jgi:crossover junction endodeoxyribonuclease RuvC
MGIAGISGSTKLGSGEPPLPNSVVKPILGIDPAMITTGYGVIRGSGNRSSLLEAGVIRVARSGAIEKRLQELFDGINELLQQYQPEAMAIEQLYSHYDRPTTAIIMGHARGVICLAAAQANVPVFHYEATKVKKLMTGNGRASKEQMQRAVQHQLSLPRPLEPADVADALAIALTHQHHKLLGDLSNNTLKEPSL